VHGVVESGESGRAVRDAEVVAVWTIRVADRAVEKSARQRTDGNGRFDLRDLPAQPVTLRVRALGFAPWLRDLDLRTSDRLVTVHLDVATAVLQEVAVRADTAADQLARVAAVSTLDAQALAATRGQTLGETIKNLPGVAVIQFGPSIAKPVIRGLNSQRVLVMNGGLRQEDQQWGTEHAPNIDSFDADAVTVVRGAATVLYGADALGGVVRVEHAALPDTGGLHGNVALNTFSNSRQGALSIGVQGADLSLPKIGATGYRLRLTSRVAGNGAAPDYFLTNTGFRELNGSLALGVTRDWGRTEVSLSRFGTELGVLRQAHVGNADDLARAMSGVPADSSFSYDIGPRTSACRTRRCACVPCAPLPKPVISRWCTGCSTITAANTTITVRCASATSRRSISSCSATRSMCAGRIRAGRDGVVPSARVRWRRAIRRWARRF
jgi:iron complex outermembrane receptor protein